MPTHSEKRSLPYGADEMYALVADVGQYPHFLPWCAAARVRKHQTDPVPQVMEADLVISFKVFRERFGSRVQLWPDERRIETAYLDGPFRYMKSSWRFRPDGAGCEVEFDVDFEMRNPVLQSVVGIFFHEAMQRVVRAFERRAAGLHRDPGA